jgi:hypothetical protein
MHVCSPNRTEAKPPAIPNPELTPYPAIFCEQVLAPQYFAYVPAISRNRNPMKISILEILKKKRLDMPGGWISKQKDRRRDGSALIFLIADS